MAQKDVRRVPARGARDGGVPPEPGGRLLGKLAFQERALRKAVDVLNGAGAVHLQDVDLVRVAQELAQAARARVQVLRQPPRAVQRDGRADEPVLVRRGHVVADRGRSAVQPVKQHARAEGRVAGGGGVVERAIAPDLLEATHIVQEPQQPRKVDVLWGRAFRQGACDLLGKVRHAPGVLHLQGDLGVLGVKALHVALERVRRPVPVYVHVASSRGASHAASQSAPPWRVPAVPALYGRAAVRPVAGRAAGRRRRPGMPPSRAPARAATQTRNVGETKRATFRAPPVTMPKPRVNVRALQWAQGLTERSTSCPCGTRTTSAT